MSELRVRFLPPRDLTGLMAAIRRHFRLSAECEISVEVDPREASSEHLDALAEICPGKHAEYGLDWYLEAVRFCAGLGRRGRPGGGAACSCRVVRCNP